MLGLARTRKSRSTSCTPVLILRLTALLSGSVAAADWIYVVMPGDNPWDLSARYLDGIRYWPRIQALNGITRPTTIPPATGLRIPLAWLRARPAVAKVAYLDGEGSVVTAGVEQPLAVGMQLATGAEIHTRTNANATLEFGDGSRLLLLAESVLRLVLLQTFENTGFYQTRVHLEQGHAENLVRPFGDGPGQFEISTPAATTAVRGTDYRVHPGADAARDDHVAAASSKAAQPLVPGKYYGRVAAVDAHEGAGPFSDTQDFRRVPPGPTVEAPAFDDKQMTLRWRAALTGPAIAGPTGEQ